MSSDSDTDVGGSKRKIFRRRIAIRGGRGKINRKETVDIKILQTNCDGYTSKKESIETIVNDRKVDVLLLNDTALKGQRKVLFIF